MHGIQDFFFGIAFAKQSLRYSIHAAVKAKSMKWTDIYSVVLQHLIQQVNSARAFVVHANNLRPINRNKVIFYFIPTISFIDFTNSHKILLSCLFRWAVEDLRTCFFSILQIIGTMTMENRYQKTNYDRFHWSECVASNEAQFLSRIQRFWPMVGLCWLSILDR